uniref:G-protein coupled receptors family 3 profile domain-containing protein n=1 Tax=Lepeophtheirus salmonis TaxID=72036 RepID=A0A0K2U1W9_LEPSM
MIGIGDSSSLFQTGGALSAFNIPLVTVGDKYPRRKPTGELQTKSVDDNVLTTAPDAAGQSKALANVVFNLEIESLILISSNPRAVYTFLAEAKRLDIRVSNVYEFSSMDFSPSKISEFLAEKVPVNTTTTVVLIVEAGEAVGLAESLRHFEEIKGSIRWLVGSIGLDLRHISSWKIVFDGGIFIEPHMPELVEFKEYFIKSLQNKDHQLSRVLQEYKEEMFSCDASNLALNLMPCDSVTPQDIHLHFQQDPRVSFVVKAVSAFSAAFKLTMINRCSNTFLDARDECVSSVLQKSDLHKDILDNLKKLSFTSKKSKDNDEETEHYFSSNGHLVANKQLIFAIHEQKKSMTPIGWYSEAGGLHIDPNYVSPTILKKYEDKIDRSPYARAITDIDRTETPPSLSIDKSLNESIRSQNEDGKSNIMLSYTSFLGRTWSLAVLSAGSIGICIALWMLIYVTIKIFDRTLNGNQTMGILLLISVVGLFLSVAPWLIPPDPTNCYARHIFHPIFAVICFGILLVKSMQLRSLINVGHGGSIPQVNQILSLIFMVAVQIVITVEWYMSLDSPMDVVLEEEYPVCSNVSKKRFLLLHLYPCILLILAFLYGVSVIKIRHNYNEGKWITCATVFIIPVFAVWAIVYYFAPVEFQDPSVGISVTTIAVILLVSIFVPKMNTINKKSSVFRKLKRSGSDTTVYTAFSGDYLHPPEAPGIRKIPIVASSSSGSPILKTTSVPQRPFYPPPHMKAPHYMYHHHHHHHHGHHRHHHNHPPYRRISHPYPQRPSRIRFNGLNYVNTSSSGSSSRMASSYRDWKQHQHYHRHHDPHLREMCIHEDPPLIKDMTQSEEEEEDAASSGETRVVGNEVTIIEGEPSKILDTSGSLKKFTAANTQANSGTKNAHFVETINNKNTRFSNNIPSNGILQNNKPSLKVQTQRPLPPPHPNHIYHHHHHNGRSRHYIHDHPHNHHNHRSHSPTDGMILTPSGLYHY